MKESRDMVLRELETEQIRRTNLTKEELQKAYFDLAKENFPDDKRIKFVADLGGCKEIGYHYELICEDWKENRNLYFENSFGEHGRQGIEFLFEKMDTVADEKQRVLTAFLLGKILSQFKHRDFYSNFCDRFVPMLVSLINTNDYILRRKIIIIFGWIGGTEEIGILTRQMLSDEDSLCRAWAAASLMQMSFNRVDVKTVREKTKTIFAQVIREERDLQACGIMIEAVQTLFDKRWIPSSAVEDVESEKIEKARKSAVRFLSKC